MLKAVTDLDQDRLIRPPADYGVPLPEWLQRCLEHVPPGQDNSCPTDPELLLACAFDYAYRHHQGQLLQALLEAEFR